MKPISRLIEKFEHQSQVLLMAVTMGIVVVIGFLDFITGFEISFSVFYLMAIGLAAWFMGRGSAIFISIVSVAVALAANTAAGAHFSSPLVPIWNTIILLAFYLVVVWLLTILHTLQQELELRVQQRTAALKKEMAERERLEHALLEYQRTGATPHRPGLARQFVPASHRHDAGGAGA